MSNNKENKPGVKEEIGIAVDEFDAKFDSIASDPDKGVRFTLIEDLLSNLNLKTKDLYLSHLSDKIESLDEKEIVKKKKDNTPKKG